jgi:CHAT domain-containing protein
LHALRAELDAQSVAKRDLQIEGATEGAAGAASGVDNAAAELYAHLIAPIREQISTALLIISPDDQLNFLPFELLEDENGRRLIEDYTIAYAPSASVLKFCLDRQRTQRDSVLALGNPNLRNPAFRLYHAEEEVRAFEGLFPQARVAVFDEATESLVKEAAADYDVLHFACHGELHPSDPILTCLRLAPDGDNDGYLHAGEVFDQQLNASLVVLSACESGLGQIYTGNELLGLTRSFLYAGAPAVVSSLWKVDDRSTAFLMQAFYQNLRTMNKAEALRQAKLATMKEFPEPFYWAAFCLQGDYR